MNNQITKTTLSIFAIFVLMSLPLTIQAQMPITNIYSFDISYSEDGVMQFKQPQFLTGFNQDGYNNQPHFINDDELYISVDFPNDTFPTDIFSLNLKTEQLTQVTRTVEAEYSPTRTPSRYNFSVVRVEADKATQRLWSLPLDRLDNGEPVFPDIKNVGYHYWLDKDRVAMFIVGEEEQPHFMIVANQREQTYQKVMDNIGRCFQQLPDGNVAIIHKMPDQWFIEKMDRTTYERQPIVQTLADSEDFIILNNGSFLMANGTKLFQYNPEIDEFWKEVGDFKFYGFSKITRIAHRAGKLVMVVK